MFAAMSKGSKVSWSRVGEQYNGDTGNMPRSQENSQFSDQVSLKTKAGDNHANIRDSCIASIYTEYRALHMCQNNFC